MNASQETNKHTFAIEGLSCSSCASSAQKLLNNIDGVALASVDFDSKTATINYETAKVSPQQLQTALDQLGYKLIIDSVADN